MNWGDCESKKLKEFIDDINGIVELKISTPYLEDGKYKSDPGLFEGLKWLLELYEVVLSPTNVKYPFIVPTKNGIILACSEDLVFEYHEDSSVGRHIGDSMNASSIIESHDRFYSFNQMGDHHTITNKIEAYRYRTVKAITHNLNGGSNKSNYALGIDDEIIALAVRKFNDSLDKTLIKLVFENDSKATESTPISSDEKEIETTFGKKYLKIFEGCRVLVISYSHLHNYDEVLSNCRKLYIDLLNVFKPDGSQFLVKDDDLSKEFEHEYQFYMIVLDNRDVHMAKIAKKFTNKIQEINYFNVQTMLLFG
jgi:hypothetical protein